MGVPLMKVKVRAPGSCGELVQGTVSGRNFLITCPVDIWSDVTVESGSQESAAGEKTLEAVRKTWDYLGYSNGSFSVTVDTTLPAGKGMASSSADISAACLAAAVIAGRQLSTDEIADIALSIEPTDGIFYPGIVMFDHLGGKLRRLLGCPPPMFTAIFDAGGEVDTLEFNKRSDLKELNKAKERLVRRASSLVVRGLARGDSSLIGQGATISALANQSILFKSCLQVIAEIAPRFGAVGVNTAHSGTVVGIIFPDNAGTDIAGCIKAVQKACPETGFLGTARLIAGGLTVLEEGAL
jgi:L-threonine kinase